MNGMMNETPNTLTGKVIKILELVSGDSKRNPGEKWYRQEFVIETFAQYPRQVCFSIWGEDRINAANLQLGEDVTITFELSSREFNERWYTTAEARNIMKLANGPVQGGQPNNFGATPNQGFQQPQPGMGTPYTQQPGNNNMPNTNVPFGPQQGGDDLPF